jgi:peptidoglycan/xylan/chitin deacetylase (PgdA/CDA1 family)
VTRDRVIRTARTGAGAAVRFVRQHLRRRPLVLMYHRVVDLPADPQLLAVRPGNFMEQLEALRRRYRVMRLSDLATALADGELPSRAVVITLDDGYADNLANAKPLLERFDLPATVFITTSQIGGVREFWWDELERLVLRPGRLPETIALSIDGIACRWELAEAAVYTEDDYRRDRSWHVELTRDPGPRQALYRSLYGLLHPMPDGAKWDVLAELRRLAAIGPGPRPTHRTMTAHEVIDLSGGGLLDVGVHTRTHPALAGLGVEMQRDEIVGARDELEALLGREVNTFAYPHGSYSMQTIEIVRQAGFLCACSSDPAPVGRPPELLRLPRVVPRDWDGDAFEGWLRSWYG